MELGLLRGDEEELLDTSLKRRNMDKELIPLVVARIKPIT